MKRSLFLLFSVIGASASFAKTTKTNVVAPYPHFNNQADNQIPASTQPIRLSSKSKSYFSGNAFVPADSFTYFYKGQTAGIPDLYDLNDDDVKYDSSITYSFLQGGYASKMKRVQTYLANKISTLELHPYKEGGFKDSLIYTFSYSGNTIQQAAATIYQPNGTYFNQVSYTNTIDAQGNVTAMNMPVYHINFTYNSQNLLLTQYDFNGLLTAPAYVEKDSFVYDTQQRLATYYRQKWDATTNNWTNNELWSYTYNAINEVTNVEKLQWSTGSYHLYQQQLYTYDALGSRTADETQIWSASANAYVSTKKLVWIYNDSELPISLTSYTWDGTSWMNAANDYQVRYWYDIVYPTNVKTISSIENFSLYPVPANESVNIHLSWKQMQPFYLTIRDVNGRVVKHWEEQKTTDYVKNVPLNNLVNGQYFLTIQGANSEPFTQKLVVAK